MKALGLGILAASLAAVPDGERVDRRPNGGKRPKKAQQARKTVRKRQKEARRQSR